VTAHRDECLLTIDGEQFVTERLESTQLLQHLQKARGRKVALWFVGYSPYRCVGSAIIALQRAKVRFRVPQIPSQ
jgi:hypothetical protein